MKWYKDIPIWENLRRINLLLEFRNLIVEYFNKVKFPGILDYDIEPRESVDLQKIRSKINNMLTETHSIVVASSIAPIIYYSPPPAIGGMSGHIDLINNVFHLHRFEVDTRDVIDIIERSVGIYEKDKNKALCRTINPFYWAVLIIDFIVSIPFKILGRVGFDQERLEGSFVGKTVKSILYLITVFAAFLTILEKLGYLEWFKNFLKQLFN